jgi:S-DNA-T family DNA segregation ATPase FtsK/SpoIIIE
VPRKVIDSADDGGRADLSQPDTPEDMATAEDALWFALGLAPKEGTEVGVLMTLTGMSRPTLYRHLAQHAKAGRAVQVSRGRWRAATTEEPHYE